MHQSLELTGRSRAPIARVCLLMTAGVFWSIQPAHGQWLQAHLETSIPSDGQSYSLTRIGGVKVAEDGAIWVLDQVERQLLRFGVDGTFLGAFGRQGEGPGELSAPRLLGMKKDSVWVWDRGTSRISVFDSTGRFVRSISVPMTGTGVLLPSGGIAVLPVTTYGAAAQDGVSPVWRVGRSGAIDTLLLVPRSYRVLRYALNGGLIVGRQPFDDAPLFVASSDGSRFVLVERRVSGQGRGQFRVRVRDHNGVTQLDQAYSYTPKPIEKKDVATAIANLAQGPSASPEGRRAIENALFVPRHFTPVSGVVAGDNHDIWLRREESDTTMATWTVLRSNGSVRGHVRLPREFMVTSANLDRIAGVAIDRDYLPSVRVYRISGD